MSNTTDNSKYKNNIAKIRDMFSSLVPNASVSVGSTIYDLVLRPIAIISGKVSDMFDELIYKSSLSYLESSGNIEKGAADAVLANYFVTRKSGEKPVGTMLIVSNSQSTTVPFGANFDVMGTTVATTATTVATYGDADYVSNSQDTIYVKAYKVGDTYCFSVIVEAVDNVDRIIPQGTQAETSSYIPGFVRAELISALEGGSAGETDSSMVSRAKSEVCSWYGCNNSIHKLLNASGITVYSCMSFDGNDPEMFRTMSSPVYIGTAGMVDVYAKTSQYPMGGSVEITVSRDITDVTDVLPKGVIGISSIVRASDGLPVSADIIWGSTRNSITDMGARFSAYQSVKLNNIKYGDLSLSPGEVIIVTYTYMPYIKELQEYIERPDVRVLGMDILVKAAIPATITLRASCVHAGHSINDISNTIKQVINGSPTGTTQLDLSDIQEYLSNTLPGAYLKSPVFMQASSYDINGRLTAVERISDGVLTNPKSSEELTGRVRFFCISDAEVVIE